MAKEGRKEESVWVFGEFNPDFAFLCFFFCFVLSDCSLFFFLFCFSFLFFSEPIHTGEDGGGAAR